MPRSTLLLILILTICMGSLLWLLRRDEASPEIDAPGADKLHQPATPEELREQPRIALPQPTKPKPKAVAKQDPESKPQTASDHATDGDLLILEVFDQRSGAEISGFNLVVASRITPMDTWVDAHRLELRLDLDEIVSIGIEAPGFEPQRIEDLSLSSAEPQRTLRIELRPVVVASGVSLDVIGPGMLPVPSVRLRVRFRELDSPRDEPMAILWQRQAKSEIGSYDLPNLAPGHYRFEVQALDAEDELAPLQLGSHELSYYGAERVQIPMQLEAGGLLSLLVRDRDGSVLGTEVMLRLEDAGGEAIETRWLAIGEDGALEAFDMLPAAKRCRLGQVLPPGEYTLRLRGQGRELARQLRLESGQDLKLEVVL